jgi:hypothetical protein
MEMYKLFHFGILYGYIIGLNDTVNRYIIVHEDSISSMAMEKINEDANWEIDYKNPIQVERIQFKVQMHS